MVKNWNFRENWKNLEHREILQRLSFFISNMFKHENTLYVQTLILEECRASSICKCLTMKKCAKVDDIGGHVKSPEFEKLWFHVLE